MCLFELSVFVSVNMHECVFGCMSVCMRASMNTLKVVWHLLRVLDEQIQDFILIKYDVWFCSLPASIVVLTHKSSFNIKEQY